MFNPWECGNPLFFLIFLWIALTLILYCVWGDIPITSIGIRLVLVFKTCKIWNGLRKYFVRAMIVRVLKKTSSFKTGFSKAGYALADARHLTSHSFTRLPLFINKYNITQFSTQAGFELAILVFQVSYRVFNHQCEISGIIEWKCLIVYLILLHYMHNVCS